MAGRRVNLATLPGKPFNPAGDTATPDTGTSPTAPARPGHQAASVPLSAIVFNPLNPRRTLVEETLAELADSLRTQGQISPITVVSRAAFLAAHPGHEDTLGTADFVALEGNRRLNAAHRAGLTHLRVDLNDALAATAADMLQSALAANTHREPVPELEEARAIQELLDTRYDGNQAAVARALSKTAAWVGQRLALLHLTPEVQELVEARELTVKAARQIGAATRRGDLAPEDQLAAARAAAEKPAPAADVNPVYGPGPGDDSTPGGAPDVNPVYAGAPAGGPLADGGRVPAGNVNPVYGPPSAGPAAAEARRPLGPLPDFHAATDTAAPTGQPLPEQRAQPADAGTLILHLDWADPVAAAQAIRSALDVKPAAHLAAALIALLQQEPEFPQIMAEFRARHGAQRQGAG